MVFAQCKSSSSRSQWNHVRQRTILSTACKLSTHQFHESPVGLGTRERSGRWWSAFAIYLPDLHSALAHPSRSSFASESSLRQCNITNSYILPGGMNGCSGNWWLVVLLGNYRRHFYCLIFITLSRLWLTLIVIRRKHNNNSSFGVIVN